jgi:hypothetical protein
MLRHAVILVSVGCTPTFDISGSTTPETAPAPTDTTLLEYYELTNIDVVLLDHAGVFVLDAMLGSGGGSFTLSDIPSGTYTLRIDALHVIGSEAPGLFGWRCPLGGVETPVVVDDSSTEFGDFVVVWQPWTFAIYPCLGP